MKNILKQIALKDRQNEKAERDSINSEIANPATSSDRRNFPEKRQHWAVLPLEA
ncbi:MAG: hypothetical protein IPN68_05170 [Bacteroidetes bacterium]|nr:hypothetical protein [Bacteroidota bacterium]